MQRHATWPDLWHWWPLCRCMEAVLAQAEEYQFQVDQTNFLKDQFGRDAEKRVRVQNDMFMGKLMRNLLKAELKATKKWGWRVRGVIVQGRWPTIRGRKEELNVRVPSAKPKTNSKKK